MSHNISNQCRQQEVLTSEWVDLSKNQRFHLVYSYSTTRSHSTIHIHNLLLLISSLVIGHSTTWVHNTHLVPLSLLAVSILAAPLQVSDRVNRGWMCKKPATTCQLVSHCIAVDVTHNHSCGNGSVTKAMCSVSLRVYKLSWLFAFSHWFTLVWLTILSLPDYLWTIFA